MTSSYRPTFLRGLMYYQNISCVNLKGLLGEHSWKLIHDAVLLQILKVRQQQQTIFYWKGKPFWPKSKLNSTNSFLCKFERCTAHKTNVLSKSETTILEARGFHRAIQLTQTHASFDYSGVKKKICKNATEKCKNTNDKQLFN